MFWILLAKAKGKAKGDDAEMPGEMPAALPSWDSAFEKFPQVEIRSDQIRHELVLYKGSYEIKCNVLYRWWNPCFVRCPKLYLVTILILIYRWIIISSEWQIHSPWTRRSVRLSVCRSVRPSIKPPVGQPDPVYQVDNTTQRSHDEKLQYFF